jgi:peptidoglycan/LPS O-acetylase OafA/YrhL
VHQPAVGLWHGAFADTPPRLDGLWALSMTLAALVTTIGVSELSFRYLEGPFLRYGRRFPYQPVQETARDGNR